MNTIRIRDYFLGKLSPTEVEALEIEIISDSEIESELQIAESILIEDYLDETLNSPDKTAFEKNYLITKERRRQVDLVKQLKKISQKNPFTEIKPSFFEQLKAAFSLRPILGALAAVALILAIGFGWRWFYPSTQTNSELIALNQKDLSDLDEFKGLTNLSLIAGKLRSDGNSTTLLQDSLSERFLLRLAFPTKIASPQTFSVKISQDGKVLHSLKQVSFQNQEVRLLLPKSILTKGEYQIVLENGSEIYNYFFTVQ